MQEAFDDVIRARETSSAPQPGRVLRQRRGAGSRGQAQRIIEDANGYRDEVIARAKGEADRFSKLLGEYRKAP